MANVFTLEVATPERLLLHEHVLEAEIPAAGGMVGILKGHAPLLAPLGIGTLTYRKADGSRHTAAVAAGYLEVSGDHVRVLADRAEPSSEIDVARAESALKRANERLSNPLPGVDIARALNAARRAQARLDAAKALGR
jgi:F-type H+-transporting ATPase subunit epsilon